MKTTLCWRHTMLVKQGPFSQSNVLNNHLCVAVLVCVSQYRAKQLYNAGYKTLSHLANADPSALSNAVENLNKKQATMMVASAKVSTGRARLLH